MWLKVGGQVLSARPFRGDVLDEASRADPLGMGLSGRVLISGVIEARCSLGSYDCGVLNPRYQGRFGMELSIPEDSVPGSTSYKLDGRHREKEDPNRGAVPLVRRLINASSWIRYTDNVYP